MDAKRPGSFEVTVLARTKLHHRENMKFQPHRNKDTSNEPIECSETPPIPVMTAENKYEMMRQLLEIPHDDEPEY